MVKETGPTCSAPALSPSKSAHPRGKQATCQPQQRTLARTRPDSGQPIQTRHSRQNHRHWVRSASVLSVIASETSCREARSKVAGGNPKIVHQSIACGSPRCSTSRDDRVLRTFPGPIARLKRDPHSSWGTHICKCTGIFLARPLPYHLLISVVTRMPKFSCCENG